MVGEAIRKNLGHQSDDQYSKTASEMACLITFLAGMITLVAGLFRLGYVDIIGSPVLLLYLLALWIVAYCSLC